MGDFPNWTLDEWQTFASVTGAVTGILALLVSGMALWLSQAGNRSAALVVRWRADGTLTLENRGPAAATGVKFEVTHAQQRDGTADPRSSHFEVLEHVDLLPSGFRHESVVFRGITRKDYRVKIMWRDGRLARQQLDIPLTQERVSDVSSLPKRAVTDKQVAELADGLSFGIAKALRDDMRGLPARRRS